MRYFKLIGRLITGAVLLSLNFGLSGCGGLSTPIDQAYYTGGNSFSIPGGYTRTIFSTNNF